MSTDSVELGLSISDSKSIISDTGAVEFAKKFRVKRLQVDFSLLGTRKVGLCQIGLKYGCSMSILQPLGGAGFRLRARLMTTQSKRWERIKAAHSKFVGRKGQLPQSFDSFSPPLFSYLFSLLPFQLLLTSLFWNDSLRQTSFIPIAAPGVDNCLSCSFS